DPIDWQAHRLAGLYQRLIKLKKSNTALWNGQWGASMIQVTNSSPAEVFSFVRKNEANKVFAVFNFSAKPQKVSFTDDLYPGSYRDFSNGESITISKGDALDMPAWSYRVFTQ
ncbi:MAG: alpha-glucosidase C-terminal domain-containing protein, partial [Gammaproteobacteria bacterium]|nr:alpha-glucosidase C-terminal domain-containing protein [Gammaproteobacteria bacterium]